MTYINDADSTGELARLDHQAGLVGKLTGLLPAHLEETDFTQVLDVGCGSGRWALDMAFRRQDVEVSAIDISPKMIVYANARAHTQRLENISLVCRISWRTSFPLQNTLLTSSMPALPCPGSRDMLTGCSF